MICKTCNGTGHDRLSRPVIKLEPYTDSDGRARKRHITLKQGSGCAKCLGLGQT